MKTIITSLICIICGYLNSFAQQTSNQLLDGSIKGIVIDAKTQKSLDYATLTLTKENVNNAQAYTNEGGFFLFKQLATGTYTIKVSYVGYNNLIVTNIEVSSGNIKELTLRLVANEKEASYCIGVHRCCSRRIVDDSSFTKAIQKPNYQNLQQHYAEEKDLQFPCLMQHKSRSIEAALKEQQIKLFNEMRVFPNPASHVLNIESMYDERKLLRLYSITGILVKTATIVHHTQLEVNDLDEGVYVVQIIDEKNDEKLFQKIAVRH